MQRRYDSIYPWRISKKVQRKLGSVDNQEWTNSILLDYLPNKPMHIQQNAHFVNSQTNIPFQQVLLVTIFFFVIIMVHKWKQYYNRLGIINVTFFHSIHLLLLLNIIKNYRCEQIIMFVFYFHISWMVDWSGYLNELQMSRNAKHASTHNWIVCIKCCMTASPSMSIISGAWKSTTLQTGVTTLQPTKLVNDCCLQSSNQKYVYQFDFSQLTLHWRPFDWFPLLYQLCRYPY